jgi:hypothetical protein
MSSRIAGKQGFVSIGLLAFAIAATIAIFRPLEVAVLNWDELGVGFGRLLGLLALPFAALWLGVSVIAMASATAISTRAVSLLAAVSIGLWLQGTFFVWDYGVFDGTPIDWSLNAGRGVGEALCWLALLAIALVRPGFFARRAAWVAAIAVGLQAVSLAGTLHLAAPLGERELTPDESTADGRSEAEPIHAAFTRFSQTRNVLVFVLDTFQSDFFSELLQAPTFAAGVPRGFSYYRNAISPYSGTARSLPSILTSRTPDRHRGKGWMARQMEGSLPAQLVGRGWQAELLSPTPHYLSCNRAQSGYRCTSQVAFLASLESGDGSAAGRTQEDREDARTVFRAAVFRLTPHFLKPLVYRGGVWRLRDPWGEDTVLAAADPRIAEETRRDLAILDALTRKAQVDGAAPSFKFIHLFGIHHPSSVGGDCAWNHEEVPTSVEGVFRSAYWRRELAVGASGCIVGRVFDLLRRLDDLGVYDDSLIFIVGDHGRKFSPVDPSLAVPRIPSAEAAARPNRDDDGGVGGLDQPTKGVPLFLVKEIGARGPLRITDAPVSLCDIPKSVFSMLEFEDGFGCGSISELGHGRAPRLHFREGGPFSGRGERSLAYSRYRVEGHSWLDGSWREDGVRGGD